MFAQHGESAIHLSCGLGQLDALKFLVKKGGSLDATDGQGDTPLHWAARQGHAHIIAYLVEQGAQINTQNKVGMLSGDSLINFNATSEFLKQLMNIDMQFVLLN